MANGAEGDVDRASVLGRPLSGVSHLGRTAPQDSWIQANISGIHRPDGVLDAFNARILKIEYRPSDPRDHAQLFEAMVDQDVDTE